MTNSSAIKYFRIAFAAIWLVYDAIDLVSGQTLKIQWVYNIPVDRTVIVGFLSALIICECGLLFGKWPRLFAMGAFLARAVEAYYIPLNDFIYFCVITFILMLIDHESEEKSWPREVLVLQTAWIYFCSALLKLNPAFLSGGDLYVRLGYTAEISPLPFPALYRELISRLWFDGMLAWSGVIAEFVLALVLLAWWFWPGRRRKLGQVAAILAISIHLFAAYSLNVFFFSTSMIAQVVLLTL